VRAGGTQRRERGARAAIALAISLAALGYAAAVVVVAAGAPDKGFLAFTGRRVVDVTPGSAVDRAGVAPGDRVVVIDGQPVISTLDYVDRLLSRSPGDQVELVFERPGQSELIRVALTLGESHVPWPAIAASLLAAVLTLLGWIARYARPGDVAARRFWRTSVVYSIVYAGALSWSHLLVHPGLSAVFFASMFLGAPLALDFALIFPSVGQAPTRAWRLAAWVPALLMLGGALVAGSVALRDYERGIATDRGLEWLVGLISALLVFVVVVAAGGLVAQYRRARRATGAERAQLRWLIFGLSLSALPTFAAVPVALADIERFLLYRYRPFVVAVAILWFTANSLSVLRVRLADVEAVIHRSAVYALASGGAVLVYIALVFGISDVAERFAGPGSAIPHIVAAAAAAALFGPLRTRVTHWLDRRFFRDRMHYVQALRELGDTTSKLQEPPELARAVVDGAVNALRATGGALYVAGGAGGDMALAHGTGEDWPARADDAIAAAEDGVSLPIPRAGRPFGVLMFGPRLDGELYSSEDRDLLAAVAGQLSVAFENAQAFGTIAEMSRTLEAQNAEIRELRDKLEDENRYLKSRLDAAAEREVVVGASKAVRELLKQLDSVAASDANVLLLGESGTGKGLIARRIHAASERRDAPFIQVDCGAIPHGVFESELFGHERGAFTGAVRKRRGHFELADGGTLFLDEIGELPLDLQPKLLRALQERKFLRVGGSESVAVNVRIVAATNRNLQDMVTRGSFREDLYFRLRVLELTVPPLRARKGDLPALVDHLLPALCRRNHRPPLSLTDDALARMKDYAWPGNVRELENVLERAAVLCDRREIDADDLALPDRPPPPTELLASLELDGEEPHEQVMEAIEKQRLIAALRSAGGNQSSAARSLGMARTTLINKLRRYGLL
jgi:transcriptional regulator with GAF, ATPase, and Fis domain